MQKLVLKRGNLFIITTDFLYNAWPLVYYYYGGRAAQTFRLYKVCKKFGFYDYVESKFTYFDKEDLGL